MDSTILAIRAIAAHYGRTLLWPVFWIGLANYIVILGVSWWLANNVSSWWWLFVIFSTPLFIVSLAIWIFCYVILRRIHPKLNKQQKGLVKNIVNNITHISTQFGTPKFIILGQIVRDVVFRRSFGESYIGEVTKESLETREMFETLRRSL